MATSLEVDKINRMVADFDETDKIPIDGIPMNIKPLVVDGKLDVSEFSRRVEASTEAGMPLGSSGKPADAFKSEKGSRVALEDKSIS